MNSDRLWRTTRILLCTNYKNHLEHKDKQKLKEKAELKTFHTNINTTK